jgi:hypothetical protein
MPDITKPYTTLTDFVTGREVPNVGAEENRQAVERFLVENKGYLKKDIEVDTDISITVAGEPYHSQMDLVVSAGSGKPRFMVIKCVAGSLGSREREVVAAARLLDEYQIPSAVVSDGRTAIVLDTLTGKITGEGMDAIPSKQEANNKLKFFDFSAFPKERREREKLIFRTYDIENVNVQRKV